MIRVIERKDLDELGTLIKGMQDSVTKRVEDVQKGLQTQAESFEEFKKRLADVEDTVKTMKRELPQDAPLTRRQGDIAPHGIFASVGDGQPLLDFPELLAMPVTHSIVRGTDRDLLQSLQDANDAVTLQLAFRTARARGMIDTAADATMKTRDFKRLNRLRQFAGYPQITKETLMHPSSGGIGETLTQTILSAQLFEPVRLALRVANLFQTVPLVNPKQDFPANRGDGIGVRGGVTADDPPPRTDANLTSPWPSTDHFTTLAFGRVKFDVVDVLAFMWFNDHMISDTVIPWMPYMREHIAFQIARARDRACFEGDIQGRTAGAHMDDHADTMSVYDSRTLWNGLRRIAANYYTDQSGGAVFTAADFRAVAKKMGRYALSPDGVVALSTAKVIHDLMAEPDVVTVDKFGPMATVKTGQLAALDGKALIPTEWAREDLGATGYGSATGTKTCVVMVDTSRFRLGAFGTVSVELTRVAPQLLNIVQASTREDFVPLEAVDANKVFAAGLTETPIAVGINVGV